MALEDLLHNRELMAKVMMVGYIASLVLIGLGLIIIMKDLLA